MLIIMFILHFHPHKYTDLQMWLSPFYRWGNRLKEDYVTAQGHLDAWRTTQTKNRSFFFLYLQLQDPFHYFLTASYKAMISL